jgi:hypothetical protein
MKNRVRVILLFSYLSFIGLLSYSLSAQQGADAGGSQLPSAPTALAVFRQVEPTLRRESNVPLKLPRFLPFMDESHPIHAVVHSATTSGYSILLANALPCDGANWCLYGTVRGSAQPISREGKAGKAVPVLLRGGIRASFFDSECDTYCSQAYVDWQQNGYYYSIGIKGPTPMKRILIKVANSAVEPIVQR